MTINKVWEQFFVNKICFENYLLVRGINHLRVIAYRIPYLRCKVKSMVLIIIHTIS